MWIRPKSRLYTTCSAETSRQTLSLTVWDSLMNTVQQLKRQIFTSGVGVNTFPDYLLSNTLVALVHRSKLHNNSNIWVILDYCQWMEWVLLPHLCCHWGGPCVGKCSPPGRCESGASVGRRPNRWPSAPSLAPDCHSGNSLWFDDTAGCRAHRADPGYSTREPPPDTDRQRVSL